MRYLISSIFLVIIMLVVPCTVQAYYDNFDDSYYDWNIGDSLDNILEWDNVALPAKIFSSGYSDQGASTTANNSFSTISLATTSTNFYFSIRAKATYLYNSTQLDSIIFQEGGSNRLRVVFGKKSGDTNYDIYDLDAARTFKDNISSNTWYQIDIEINCDSDQYSYSIDGGSYSSYYSLASNCSYIDDIIFMQNSNGSNLAFDNLYIDSALFIEELDIAMNYTGVDDLEISSSSEDLLYNDIYYCYLGTTCDIDFNYGEDMIGKVVFLIPTASVIFPLANPESVSVASTTIGNYHGNEEHLTLPDRGTAGDDSYCFYVMATSTISVDDKVYCGLTASWKYDAIFADIIASYDCSTICDDLATSSDWWFGFQYGVNCGSRKLACWALIPNINTAQNFANTIRSYQKEFPLSLFLTTIDYFDTIKDNAQSTTSAAITLDGFFPGDQSNYVVLDSNTFHDKLGSVWDTLYATMENAMYFLTFLYFVFWFIKFTGGLEKAGIDDQTNVMLVGGRSVEYHKAQLIKSKKKK